jgi:hypothetical protein
MTLLNVAILVGTELVGAGAAASWATAACSNSARPSSASSKALILTALTGLFYFLGPAVAHEPIRG